MVMGLGGFGGIDLFQVGLLLAGLVLTLAPQWWVQRTVSQFHGLRTQRQQTGAEVATSILRENGIYDVKVEESHGFLSDHYDPSARTVRLSADNYHGASVSAIAIAAHEVGHAIQHARGYFPVVARGALFPVVSITSMAGPWLIMGGFLLMAASGMKVLGNLVAWLGVIFYGGSTLFHLVTLPVEIDASSRAIKVLETKYYLTSTEVSGAKKVLIAAALTYMAAALYSLMELAYYVMRLLASSQNRQEE
ncbi:MAG: zinc metallopeptidase [Vampirovibrionales bacterium]